ncbi:MAG TPA: CRISPR system precrRNA processing endoribonuclease RAMP protein Cas6, partial [Planctomycetaceae bacterium]|nr:CRISPR system precrRNA processing endoribonuclease RAMP protein Cas6 [Planctomycetaceae bacterium]
LGREALDRARRIRSGPWHGDRLDLLRYSARQKRELELHGVSGHFDLPDGPGSLWPLLLAAHWLHVGKGTVMGLGEIRIEPTHDRL